MGQSSYESRTILDYDRGMRWFRRTNADSDAGTPLGSREAAIAAFAELAAASGRGPILASLTRAIETAQRARLADARDASVILAAAHLAAGAACHVDGVPAESEIRSIGHAAVALAQSTIGEDQRSPAEEVARAQFSVARGSVRGSIYVPRDVEYAFAGDVRGLAPLALDPVRAPRLRQLLAAGIDAALATRPDAWTQMAREFLARFEAAARLG